MSLPLDQVTESVSSFSAYESEDTVQDFVSAEFEPQPQQRSDDGADATLSAKEVSSCSSSDAVAI